MPDALDKLKELAEKIDHSAATASNMSWIRNQLDSLIPALEAEIAALRERYRIAHESAVGLRETVNRLCEHERLAVAAALREAADDIAIDAQQCPKGYVGCHAQARIVVLDLIPPADRDALEAHDAEVRDRALEKVAQKIYSMAEGASEGYALACSDNAAVVRALKGGSR